MSLLSAGSLRAEVDLEAISKKVSLWPREILLTQDVKLNLKQPDGTVKAGKIATGTKMEVVSVQTTGVEVRLQSTTIILPAAATDLEARINQSKAAKATAAIDKAVTPGTSAAPAVNSGPVDPEAVRAKFAKFAEDGTLSLAEINQLTPAEIKVMPENIQEEIENARTQLVEEDKATAKSGTKKNADGRPKPELQDRQMTPFIKEVMDNLQILEGASTNLKDYTNSISFKDKEYYLLIIASSDDDTKTIMPKIIDYYNRVNQVTKKYEIVYVTTERTPQGMEAFVKDMKMPWPVLNHETIKSSKTFGKYGKWGVPNLVVVDRKGEVMSQGYVGPEKVYKPQEVLFDLASLLQLPPGVFK